MGFFERIGVIFGYAGRTLSRLWHDHPAMLVIGIILLASLAFNVNRWAPSKYVREYQTWIEHEDYGDYHRPLLRSIFTFIFWGFWLLYMIGIIYE